MSTSERGVQRKVGGRPVRRVRRKGERQGSTEDAAAASRSLLPAVEVETESRSLPQATTETTATKRAESVLTAEERPRQAGYLGTSAPPIAVPPWKMRKYIERAADLVALCRDLMDIRALALDAEFSQSPVRLPDKPSHQLSLLQLAVDQDYRASYVVDTQRIADLSPLLGPLQNPASLKLFHSMGSDAKVLLSRGLVADNTLDLEAVSRSLFGERESGLQAMLVRACGIWLDKSFQRADWSRRPLSAGMLVYAAQDAEMTLMLYYWLRDNYGWATTLHHIPAGEPSPAVAGWLLPYLEGSRPRHVALAVAEAGISTDIAAQEAALRQALTAVLHPPQRARVIRVITDLDLRQLAPDLYPYLTSPAAEERQSAVRGLGRLHDKAAIPLVRPLLGDNVAEVRQAATVALEQLSGRRPVIPRPANGYRPHTAARVTDGLVKWSSEPKDVEVPAVGGWQDTLRARYGLSPILPDESGQGGSDDD